MRYLKLLLFISCLSPALGQENRTWQQGKLTWDDFYERKNVVTPSSLKYTYIYTPLCKEINNTVYSRVVSQIVLDKKSTWINSAFKTGQQLRYNQVIFDLAELGKTELDEYVRSNYEFEVFRFNNARKPKTLLGIEKNIENRLKEFQNESESGANLEAIEKWEQIVAEKLSTADTVLFPSYTHRPKMINYVNIGGNSFVGGASQYFKPGPALTFGIGGEFNYGGYIGSDFHLGLSMLTSKALNSSSFDELDNDVIAVGFFTVMYGHVFKNDRRKYKPFLIGGLGLAPVVGGRSVGLGFETDFLLKKKYVAYSGNIGKYHRGFYRAGIRVIRSIENGLEGIHTYQGIVYFGIGLEKGNVRVIKKK